jgi:hypothetical protein
MRGSFADQIGQMVGDCDIKLLITDSTRIAELRDAAHVRIVIGRGPAEQEIASLKQLRRDLSADVVSQYLMQLHEPLSSFGPPH